MMLCKQTKQGLGATFTPFFPLNKLSLREKKGFSQSNTLIRRDLLLSGKNEKKPNGILFVEWIYIPK